jgi:epoxide hydrolase
MSETSTDSGVRPFRIDIPQAGLEDLQDRLARTRWPDQLGAEWAAGVPLDYLRDLAAYWATGYDWRRHEARLNEFPQFTTVIDGQRVHFLHVRSPEPDALPLIVTHGWPGSVVEFAHLLGPLTAPADHGGDPADAFHVVVPAIPGFGFSSPLRETGWTVPRIAAAWVELMGRLGYQRYGAHGGDWGGGISRQVGITAPDRVAGVHVNYLPARVSDDPAELASLSETEKAAWEASAAFRGQGRAYGMVQATRPQTLGYGLTDSPAGQLAWIVEKFREWTDGDGVPVDRDVILTNVMLYWLTGTAGSSARLYYEAAQSRASVTPSTVSTGVAVFPRELIPAIRRYAERTDNIVHWSEFDRGGHFAALEVPDLLLGDLRKFFCRFR